MNYKSKFMRMIELFKVFKHDVVVHINNELKDIIESLDNNIVECYYEYEPAYSDDDSAYWSIQIVTASGEAVSIDYPSIDESDLQMIMSFVDIRKYKCDYAWNSMLNAIALLECPRKLIEFVDWLVFACYDDEIDIDELILESTNRGYGESTMALIRWTHEQFGHDEGEMRL